MADRIDPTTNQRRRVAMMMGYVSGLHGQAKALGAEGVEEMDMICCQLEDVFGTLEPLLGERTDVEAAKEYH